ncbi:MAG TPA: hypothetical protein VFN08_16000 [Gemmatimonadales bacterium]|jgi:hypothetical protein|nr:hypothetical protein [Gemmatimonadales bacterium]
MCRVLVSGLTPLDAELLMKGMAGLAPKVELRYVAAAQLPEVAAAWRPDGLLLGDRNPPDPAALEECAVRLAGLVIIHLTARGTRAMLLRQGADPVDLPGISLRTLALLLCGQAAR